MTDSGRALTLYQPWASAIVGVEIAGVLYPGRKRLENRGRAPMKGVIGKRIWIHAGKMFDEQGSKFCAQRGFAAIPPHDPRFGIRQPPIPFYKGVLPTMAIVGSARVVGWVRETDRSRWELAQRIAAREGSLLRTSDLEPWWVGPVGWLLDDVRRLSQPVEWPGSQGLWPVPPLLAERIQKAGEVAA